MDAEKNLQAYEADVNAEKTIRDAVLNSYNSFKPELQMVADYEQSQLPSFYGSFNGYNTGAQQLSVADQLQKAWSEVGRRAATADVARGVLDVRKQRAEDLIRQGLNQWNQGYQGAQNAYNRWFQQKQFEEQVRQFNAQLARMGSGNQSVVLPDIDEDSILEKAWQLKMENDYNKNEAWNKGANDAWARQNQSGYNSAGTQSLYQPRTTVPSTKSYAERLLGL